MACHRSNRSSRGTRRSTSGGGGGGGSPLVSVDRAVPHRCCSESSCLLLLCLQRPTQATQHGHQPAAQMMQPGAMQATPDSRWNSDRRLTGSTHESVPATAAITSGIQKKRKNGTQKQSKKTASIQTLGHRGKRDAAQKGATPARQVSTIVAEVRLSD